MIKEGQLWQDNYWVSLRPYYYVRRLRVLSETPRHVLACVEEDTTPFAGNGRTIQVRRELLNNQPADRFGFCLVNEESS